ncbi:uncharacterized protein LOC141679727 [Apium graveolens]|uniref:uncharacterized protein LOC141679727 n=1 Tax=Apium graveolens TaxID=4045 RepID=UPI003D7AEBE8
MAALYNQAKISSVPILQLPSNQPSEFATPVFPPSYPAQTRTFNMNIKDAVQNSEVVAGTLSVNNGNAKVLFDSGATRSFISESFVGKLDCEIELLVEPLSIIVANQEQLSVKNKKLFRQGCEGYLAHVIDRSKETPNIESIPIFSEFPDVFPDELPGLPPDRQIEFSINLAPGVEPVSKAPYRMAPAEMKELAKQLQELLDK